PHGDHPAHHPRPLRDPRPPPPGGRLPADRPRDLAVRRRPAVDRPRPGRGRVARAAPGRARMTPTPSTTVDVDGRELSISNPEKVFFSARGETKLDLVRYYLAVGEGALRGVYERPTVLKRFPNGAEGEFFYQKRVPEKRPDWLQTATVSFPSGRSAEELCPVDVSHLIWAVNLGCLDLNPWPVRRGDLDHPDELRVDLDPQPEVPFEDVRRVTLVVRDVLDEHGMTGFPKTSGSRG